MALYFYYLDKIWYLVSIWADEKIAAQLFTALPLCLKKSSISLNGSQVIKDWPAQLSCVSAIKMPSLVLSFSLFRLEWTFLDQGVSLNLSQSFSYLKYWRRTCISSNSWEKILLRSSVVWLYSVSLAVSAELAVHGCPSSPGVMWAHLLLESLHRSRALLRSLWADSFALAGGSVCLLWGGSYWGRLFTRKLSLFKFYQIKATTFSIYNCAQT